jgi:RNA polymerase sigma-70 factor (ECF subfamily)
MLEEHSSLDSDTFEMLYKCYFRRVFSFVRKNVEDVAEAEDVTHDVFLKLWKGRKTYSDVIPGHMQLFVIARQLVINHYRKDMIRQRALRVWENEAPSSTRIDISEMSLREKEISLELKMAIECLPSKRREIFEKSRFREMSYDEIASSMDISRSTVEGQMVKALRFLRERLGHLAYFIIIFFSIG